MFKGKSETDNESETESEKPILTDFKMDAEHRKFVLHEEYDHTGLPIKANNQLKNRSKSSKIELKSEKVVKGFGKDNGENRICLLFFYKSDSADSYNN